MRGARVYLWGKLVGTVVLPPGESVTVFSYDKGYVRSGIEFAPVTMPLSDRNYTFPALAAGTFHGLPGALSDSLPDKFGNAVINAWLSSQGKTSGDFNVIDRLCYVGSRGMGAVTFEPAEDIVDYGQSGIELDLLVKAASDILSRRNFSADIKSGGLDSLIRVGTSAGGARAKALIAWNEETGEIRSGQADAPEGFSQWVFKFDSVTGNRDKEAEDVAEYTVIEYAYSLMAKACGIEMTECRLYEENGRKHFITKRFDRTDSGGRIHMLSLAGMANYDYNIAGQVGYEECSRIMRMLNCFASDSEQLYRRMVFNCVAQNNDDHVKNISFLMDRKGNWKLSPAYDVTYAYNPKGLWTGQHQLSVNGKRTCITKDDLKKAASAMDISDKDAELIIDDTISVVGQWPEFAKQAGLSDSRTREVFAGIRRAEFV